MKVTDVRMETYRWKRTRPIRNGRYVYPTAGWMSSRSRPTRV